MPRRPIQSEVRAQEYVHKWDDVAIQIERIETYYGVKLTQTITVEPGGKLVVITTESYPLACPVELQPLLRVQTKRYSSGEDGIGPPLMLMSLMKHQSELAMLPTFWGADSEAVQDMREALAQQSE